MFTYKVTIKDLFSNVSDIYLYDKLEKQFILCIDLEEPYLDQPRLTVGHHQVMQILHLHFSEFKEIYLRDFVWENRRYAVIVIQT